MVLRRPLTEHGAIEATKINMDGSFRRFSYLLEFIKRIRDTHILDAFWEFTDGFGDHGKLFALFVEVM